MNSKKLGQSGFLVLVMYCAAPAQSDLTITATSNVANKPAAYIFSFTSDREVTPTAELAVVFSAGFNLTTLVLADSRTMDGGLQVRVRQDTVWVQRSGRGKTLAAGTKIDLILAAVTWTDPANRINEFEILHKEKDGMFSRSRQRAEVYLFRTEKQQN